ncbi:MAG: hypothetical protein QXY40_04075 [Candidatus Methanomethylicia archaeon]
MSFSSGEVEGLRSVVGDMVSMFRAIWEEVDQQFSELNREERYKVFSTIAPILVDMLYAITEDVAETTVKIKKKKKE